MRVAKLVNSRGASVLALTTRTMYTSAKLAVVYDLRSISWTFLYPIVSVQGVIGCIMLRVPVWLERSVC